MKGFFKKLLGGWRIFAERLYFHLVFKSHYMSLMKDQMAKRHMIMYIFRR